MCHLNVGSYSVTFHPTQVNTLLLNPSHNIGWHSIYLPRRDGRLSCPSFRLQMPWQLQDLWTIHEDSWTHWGGIGGDPRTTVFIIETIRKTNYSSCELRITAGAGRDAVSCSKQLRRLPFSASINFLRGRQGCWRSIHCKVSELCSVLSLCRGLFTVWWQNCYYYHANIGHGRSICVSQSNAIRVENTWQTWQVGRRKTENYYQNQLLGAYTFI